MTKYEKLMLSLVTHLADMELMKLKKKDRAHVMFAKMVQRTIKNAHDAVIYDESN